MMSSILKNTIKFVLLSSFTMFFSPFKAKACSGTGERAFCNILHGADFATNGLVWIGEPNNNCITYNSYAGNFNACQFSVIDVLHGSINQNDTIFPNTDSLVWVIGGPSNLCYENANYTDGQHLFATSFRSHYAYDSTFSGYSTFAFNADHFNVSDTMVGNFINDFSYFYPNNNIGPDTILLSQLQNLVNNCTSDLYADNQKITIYTKTNSNIFTVTGDLSNYTVQVLNIDGTIVEDYSTETAPLHINTATLSDGLYFIKMQHNNLPDVYVERILKD